MRQKDDVDLTPVEWQFQYFAYREQITPASHGALRTRLERASKSDNRPSDLWACLAQVYVDEYAFGFPGGIPGKVPDADRSALSEGVAALAVALALLGQSPEAVPLAAVGPGPGAQTGWPPTIRG